MANQQKLGWRKPGIGVNGQQQQGLATGSRKCHRPPELGSQTAIFLFASLPSMEAAALAQEKLDEASAVLNRLSLNRVATDEPSGDMIVRIAELRDFMEAQFAAVRVAIAGLVTPLPPPPKR